MPQSDPENLLSRWSRRKHQVAEEARQEALTQELPTTAKPEPELSIQVDELEESQAPPELTDADMPEIETLNADSDFSGFMSSGVSDKLRNLALRKLFSAPSFNIRDGLDDYDDDYTTFEKLGDIITSDMKHQVEMEAKKKLERETEEIASREAGNPESEDPQGETAQQQAQEAEADLQQSDTEVETIDTAAEAEIDPETSNAEASAPNQQKPKTNE